MNALRTLEHDSIRTREANIIAQSRVLLDIVQKEIDSNRVSKRFHIQNMRIYQENIQELRKHNVLVTDMGDYLVVTY